jgi:hypothetical protein
MLRLALERAGRWPRTGSTHRCDHRECDSMMINQRREVQPRSFMILGAQVID